MGIRLTKAFLFDFDGTLIDSEQAIYRCFQSITKQLAPKRLDYAKNILIGPPLRDTASEILGPDYHGLLDEFVKLFIAMHDEQIIEHTQPYPDVIQVLKQLHNKNIPMAVATNKRLVPTQKLMDYFGWNDYFSFIECSDTKSKIRSKEKMIEDIILKSPEFQKGYYIGDTIGDANAANINGVPFIRASYGYGKKQNWTGINVSKVIHKFRDLEEFYL